MNKALGTFLLGVTAMGVIGINGTVFADATTANPTTANTTDNTQLGATTTGSLNFKGGTLSLYNVQDTAAFNTPDTAFSTQDVYTNGLSATNADKKMTATVDDFLGEDADTWTLTVNKSKWAAGDDGVASGATALDTGAHLSVDKGEITTDGLEYDTGSEGHNELTEQTLSVAIDQGTVVKKGAYTNTLTWNLVDPAAADQD